jgi:hypothetical protein
MGHGENVGYDRRIILVDYDIANETLIDHQNVDWQTTKVTEG